MNRSLHINWPALLLAAAFVGMLGYQSMALKRLEALQPPVVATVDLHRVMTQTDERARHDRAIERYLGELEGQLKAMSDKIESLEQERELYAATSDKFQEVNEQVSMAALEYQAFSEHARRKAEQERARRLRSLYTKAKELVSAEAEANGYDIVFVNDALGEIQPGNESDVSMQISARRMLYCSSALDITDAVIERMNAATRSQVQR